MQNTRFLFFQYDILNIIIATVVREVFAWLKKKTQTYIYVYRQIPTVNLFACVDFASWMPLGWTN